MGDQLRIGFGEADLTPPKGLLMQGSLAPRTNVGTTDPLLAKTLVAENRSKRIAVVGVDLIALPWTIAEQVIAAVHQRTGIDPAAIIISCSHTHSGPYTTHGDYTDAAYLATLPERIAASARAACEACEPASMHVGRTLVHSGLHNRRVRCEEGMALNTWMVDALNDLDRCPRIMGSAGPIDPELWAVRFDAADGRTLGVLVNFSLHTNAHFGDTWSADYPGVIAEAVRQAFGPNAATVFTPGACADINPTFTRERWRMGAELFAGQAVAAARRAIRVEDVAVDACQRIVEVPPRDPASDPPGAVERLNWGGGRTWGDVFAKYRERVAALPRPYGVSVSAARLGPFAIATNPGELFVEHGLSIKGRSPFRYTVVAELTNGSVGYQPTRAAFEQGGYETLVGANTISPEGIEMIVDSAVELLQVLHARG